LFLDRDIFFRIFQLAPIGIGIINFATQQFIAVNREGEKLLGFSASEMIGKTTQDLNMWVNPEQRAGFYKRLEDEKCISAVQVTLKRKDGRTIVGEMTLELIAVNENRYVIGIFRDITQLEESERRWRETADQLPTVIVESDLAGKCTYSNQYGHDITGYTREDLAKGLNIKQLIDPSNHDQYISRLSQMAQGIEVPPAEFQIICKDGTQRWGVSSSAPIKKNEKIVGIRTTVIDITDRKKAEQEKEEIIIALRVLLKEREREKAELKARQIFKNLTRMELKIVEQIRQGKSTIEIAEIFNLSPKTIEVHRRNLRNKLNIPSKIRNLEKYFADRLI